ncbi:MAG: magnesium transporter CorA family protein [Cryobacterium sp.]|nr:magnesium transporter CorA family protein [Cryobacterium sp.]
MTLTRLYRNGKRDDTPFPLEDISELIKEESITVWADFVDPSAKDLELIEDELGLHELAIEDALTGHQRPKLDRYDTHLFIVAYAVIIDPNTGAMKTAEVRAFVTPHALITVHGPEFDIEKVVRRWDENSDLTSVGIGFLVWGLLDVIVDGHFDAVQQLDISIENLEDALFDEKPRDREVQKRSFEVRKTLVLFRRTVLPMREVVNSILRRESFTFDAAMNPYFQDVYDHVLRVSEWTDSLRDLVATIMETNLSIQGNRANLIMKKVTSWAAIIAVPTAITGFYGQNLPYPGEGQPWGFWLSSALILAGSFALYFAFKKRDWL